MKSKELTMTDLFESLLEFEFHGKSIDLHNDFNCTSILYKAQTNTLSLKFERAILTSYKHEIGCRLTELTIDNFYRGRYQIDESLHEFSHDGKSYFYIEFDEGLSLELFANKVLVSRI